MKTNNLLSKNVPKGGWDFFSVSLSIILFLSAVVPDIKLERPKLLLLEMGLYGILFLWVFSRFYLGKIVIRRSMVFLPALVYAASTTLFYLFSPDKIVALSELKRSLLSFSAFFVVANIIDSDKKRYLIIASWSFGVLLASLYGIAQHFGGFWIFQVPMYERIISTFGNPIFFAAQLIVVLPLAIGLAHSNKQSFTKLLINSSILVGLTALYFTQTRAAFIALSVSLMVFFGLKTKFKKLNISLILSLMVFLAVIAFATKNIWFRQQAHTLIWRDTLVMWSHYPWFGTGPGTFYIYFPEFASSQLKNIWPQGQFIVNDAHNEYLQLLSETGIVGFGIFVWLISTAFLSSLRKQESRKLQTIETENNRYLQIGIFSASVGLLAMNFFSVDMRFIISSVFLFALFGLADSYNSEPVFEINFAAPIKIIGMIAVIILGYFTFSAVLKPYIAQKNISSTPDFFDKKILEPAQTIKDLEILSQKFPKESLIFEKLGWVYSKEKNWPKAIENYSKAYDLNPKIPGPLNNLGNIYFLTGNRPKAIEYWRKSLDLSPNQLDSRLNLATAYYYNGQLKQAVEELKTVQKIDPKNEKALVMLKQMTE